MNKLDQFIGGSLVVALSVNLAAAYAGQAWPAWAKASFVALSIATVVYITFRVANLLWNYYALARYAVLVYFLNENKDLLLIQHPYHKRLLPPGGRIKRREVPHTAVAARLKEEAGIAAFEFHPSFHKPAGFMISEIVEDVPRPLHVHWEHRSQRGLVRSHYAFIYVCRTPNGNPAAPLRPSPPYQPRWLNLQAIYALPNDLIPFDDILRQYEEILSALGEQVTPTQPIMRRAGL